MSTEAEGGWGAVRKKVEKREKKKYAGMAPPLG